MNTTQAFDGSIFLWVTVLILATIIAVFAIRAFSTTRAARSQFEDEKSRERLSRLENENKQFNERLTAIEKVLNDV